MHDGMLGSRNGQALQSRTQKRVDRRRILLLSAAPFFGGAETYLVKLARLLCQHYEVRAIVADSKLAVALAEIGVVLESKPLARSRMYLRYIHAAFHLCLTRRRWRPDVLHLNGQAEAHLAWLVPLLRVPAVIIRHAQFNDMSVPRAKQPLVLLEHRSAKAVVCVSELLRGQLARAGLDGRKLHCIPTWVESSCLTDRHNVNRPVQGSFRMVSVGRLVPLKGLMDAVNALKHLSGVMLDVVGDGPQRAELEAAAIGLPVTFHGFQQDCTRFYDRADLLLFPSYMEGLPQVPLEAMARGLPCLLSNIEVHLEIADNGRCAAIFRCGDTGDLVEQIRTLQTRPDRLRELRRSALRRVRQVYTEDAVRGPYLALYDYVIKQHTPRKSEELPV